MRTAFRTYGGKNKLAPWIARHLPVPVEGASTYCEPFCRAASVFFATQPQHEYSRAVLNDLDKMVANYLIVLKEQPEALIAALEATPYSQDEFMKAQIPVKENPVEEAKRFYIWSNQGWAARGGIYEGRGGWRPPNKHRNYAEWFRLSHLWKLSQKLQAVDIMNKDAFNLIPEIDSPDTIFYIDPPYLPQTRTKRWRTNAYVHELTHREHERLAKLLNQVKGYVVLSHYECPEYNMMYPSWKKYTKEANGKTEALYINEYGNRHKMTGTQ